MGDKRPMEYLGLMVYLLSRKNQPFLGHALPPKSQVLRLGMTGPPQICRSNTWNAWMFRNSCPPGPRTPPPEIRPYSGLIDRWFPFIRPYSILISGGSTLGGVGWPAMTIGIWNQKTSEALTWRASCPQRAGSQNTAYAKSYRKTPPKQEQT